MHNKIKVNYVEETEIGLKVHVFSSILKIHITEEGEKRKMSKIQLLKKKKKAKKKSKNGRRKSKIC